ncbi:hypothetical protein DFH06DRAFT_1201840, partial [Mycena polygramma]
RLRTLTHHLNKSKMSTASHVIHNTNKACCSIPPVESQYTPKGTSDCTIGPFTNVYVTGDKESKNAIVCGADIIASTLDTIVYMPDFFGKGNAFPTENFHPETKECGEALQAFFKGIAEPGKARDALVAFGKNLKEGAELQAAGSGDQAVTVKHTKVGVYGFCWGQDTPFDSVSIVHPAMLSVEDAEKLTVPLGIYLSKDDPVDEYIKIVQAIAKKPFATKNDNKYYSNMFEDLYTRLAAFFAKTL